MREEGKNDLHPTKFSDFKLEELTDINSLRIDGDKSVEERRKQYLRQVGNPYMVRVGNTMVKISFSDSGTSFEDAFENLLTMS